MRKFSIDCSGCYREIRSIACFMSGIAEQISCPCLNCLLKTNCHDICNSRKEVVYKFSHQIAEVYNEKAK